MKKIVTIMAAVMAMFSSCSKSGPDEIETIVNEPIKLNITVTGLSSDTKAMVKTGWVSGDQIKIWYDTNTASPDLTIQYNGSSWSKTGTIGDPGKASGTVKAVYDGDLKVAATSTYTFSGNTLSINLNKWTFLTQLQVVVDGLVKEKAAQYKLSCDKFTPISGYTVGDGEITAAEGIKGFPASGIANDDGVAFVFASADWAQSADFRFTLTDRTGGDPVYSEYVPITTIQKNDSGIKALKISNAETKFMPLPDGVLPGIFTVGDGKKVRFSKGNLQYQASTGTWRFAENQYDAIGKASGNTTKDPARKTQADWIDLFGWGATGMDGNANPFEISGSSTSYYQGSALNRNDSSDWGVCIGEGWYTLSAAEMLYLIENKKIKIRCTVCGKSSCYILIPDNLDATKFKDVEIYTDDTWPEAQDSGLVCLPGPGSRNVANVTQSPTSPGAYWLSSSGPTNAYYLKVVSGDQLTGLNTRAPYYGHSVRLVIPVD